jgi:hypothetical protein
VNPAIVVNPPVAGVSGSRRQVYLLPGRPRRCYSLLLAARLGEEPVAGTEQTITLVLVTLDSTRLESSSRCRTGVAAQEISCHTPKRRQHAVLRTGVAGVARYRKRFVKLLGSEAFERLIARRTWLKGAYRLPRYTLLHLRLATVHVLREG